MDAPLANIKIVDFSWSVVGPTIATYLSYYGAEVVKVESIFTPEVTRRSAPFKDNVVGINGSLVFPTLNTNKYSISLNLKHPKGREIALSLVAWADIVVESATSSTVDKLGLDYAELKRVNEDIIVLNASGQGQTGPFRNHPGYGDTVVALVGFPEVTGWPDRDTTLPPGAYTDSVTPWFGSLAILAALEYRNRTGIGQYIDLSQLEASLHMLASAVVLCSANNVVSKRAGNQSLTDAPHGVYRCFGEERWCAIAVTSEAEWKEFCRILGNPEWTRSNKFSTLLQRKKNEDELDRLVEAWTQNLDAEEVMTQLQTAGIAAGVVENIGDLHADPQLKHRRYFQTVEHHEIGHYTVEMPPMRFSNISAEIRQPAPRLGEHTEYVCCELLGISTDEFIRLNDEGIFE